jgi:hypothetical protein
MYEKKLNLGKFLHCFAFPAPSHHFNISAVNNLCWAQTDKYFFTSGRDLSRVGLKTNGCPNFILTSDPVGNLQCNYSGNVLFHLPKLQLPAKINRSIAATPDLIKLLH